MKPKPPREEPHTVTAIVLLAVACGAAFVLYSALDTFYPGAMILYGVSSYEADPFERAFLFWFGGLALVATTAITTGLSLLLPAPKKAGDHGLSRRSIWIAATALLLLLLAVKFGVLHDSATMDDENVYHFTARLLTHGRLSLPTDIPAEFFGHRWGVNYRDGKLFPMYSHGWPALLALGYILHLPWLIGPLVMSAVFLLAIDFARRIFGPPTARLAMLLLFASPLFILTGSTDLSPLATALGTLLVVACGSRYCDDPRARWLVACGVGGGLVLLARPADTIGLTPFFLYLLYRNWKNRSLLDALALVTPVGCGLALYMAANYAMTGNPFLPTYALEFLSRGVKGGAPLGFGIDYSTAVGGIGVHTFTQGIANSVLNLIRLNTWILGWPAGLLLVLGARMNVWTRLIATALAVHALFYITFFNPSLCLTGPIYFFGYGILLVVLAASAILRIEEWLPIRPAALVAAILFVNLTMFAPMYVKSLFAMTEGTSLLDRTLDDRHIHHAVVFVKNVQAPWAQADPGKSFAYHPRSNASFDDDIVILNDVSPEKDREALAKYFPGREGFQYGVEPGWVVKLDRL